MENLSQLSVEELVAKYKETREEKFFGELCKRCIEFFPEKPTYETYIRKISYQCYTKLPHSAYDSYDLIQEGFIKLMDIVKCFDPNEGKFENYFVCSVKSIKEAMHKFITNTIYTVGSSKDKRDLRFLLQTINELIKQKKRENPAAEPKISDDELKQALIERNRNWRKESIGLWLSWRETSLDNPIKPDEPESGTFHDVIGAEDESLLYLPDETEKSLIETHSPPERAENVSEEYENGKFPDDNRHKQLIKDSIAISDKLPIEYQSPNEKLLEKMDEKDICRMWVEIFFKKLDEMYEKECYSEDGVSDNMKVIWLYYRKRMSSQKIAAELDSAEPEKKYDSVRQIISNRGFKHLIKHHKTEIYEMLEQFISIEGMERILQECDIRPDITSWNDLKNLFSSFEDYFKEAVKNEPV